MRRLGNLALSTLLVGAAFAGGPAAAGPGHDHRHDHGHGHGLSFTESVIDADQGFRGLDAVDRRTAWVTGGSASGGPGRVFRTVDGGRTWQDVSPPDTTGLLFRDVEARSATEAVILAIGPGDASRIYRTTDGGATWTAAFVNDDPAAFYDCMAFFPGGRKGLALSDPVAGKFRILATRDAGRSWTVLPSSGMPAAVPTEAGFAASGDCLVTAGRSAYFGSGGAVSRVFRSDDRGLTWTATDSTIPPGEAAGVFALAFRTPTEGVAVGGDFAEPADGVDAVATTRDGWTWRNAGDLTHLAEDAAYVPRGGHLLLVTGQSGDVMGTSLSRDGGRSWTKVSDSGWHALDCTPDGSCWAAGAGGRVARLAR
ncbi:oxidoreductase [Nocardioides sp. MAH-18]|uniref:Oxidoreductase n=1 Tax=Nocardioides agri TaxID=2682843 RepID=A0A6L6XRX0_9ACTN|nr:MULTISPECIES: oxidoreductase [unclassified Nocardioides]MBA2955243.1 oxidoreductase [Nocardioides sp. CGMCC 1.13656]MVQ50094.1 oxidoreductase [Nocardioides sp. MAH-18]